MDKMYENIATNTSQNRILVEYQQRNEIVEMIA